jgi:nicotinamide phosphoribosyltransferase
MTPYRSNQILDADSYSFSHPPQYPDGASQMHCYFSSRGGRFGTTLANVGLQGFLQDYLTTPITMAEVEEAAAFVPAHGEPFNLKGWTKIVKEYGGFMPVQIRALPEGLEVPTHRPLFTVDSVNDPDVFWVAGHLENQLVRMWYPMTVSTQSYYIKKIILEALELSSDDPRGELPFKLHCFGSRGVSSRETAGIGGMAHLVNFMGSDTIEGIRYARHHYGAEMAGFSIPAAQHGTASAGGKSGELAFYRKFVQTFLAPGKTAACVSDTYDYFNAVENYWGEELREEVKNSGGTLVIRPDSGEPVEVILKTLQILERKVGMTKNFKGYKVLPKYFRVIQGDGVCEDSIREIYAEILKHKYSASNLAFGTGGAGLQKLDRDTQKCAYKNAWMLVNGQGVDIFKDPITDPGKKSLRGRQDLGSEGKLVYDMGKIPTKYTFEDLRTNSERNLFSGYRAA